MVNNKFFFPFESTTLLTFSQFVQRTSVLVSKFLKEETPTQLTLHLLFLCLSLSPAKSSLNTKYSSHQVQEVLLTPQCQ